MNSNGESHSHPQDIQPQLFGADVPALTRQGSTEQPASYSEERKAARDRAFDRADRWRLQQYEECMRLVGRAKAEWGAWDVTKAFEEKHSKLDAREKKALGGLFTHWLESGLIREAGFGKRPNGNIGATYKLNG